MGVGDPVAAGLVASLARTGGNATGFSNMFLELMPKRLELLCELVPEARVIALLVNSAESQIRVVQEAARAKEVQLAILNAGTEGEIDAAFASLVELLPARFSSAAIRFSPAGASSSWRWHHAMPFQRAICGAISPRPAA
jgi:ABC-type uncharacterized transport system substrate-binding protein